jgi:transposase
MPRPYSEDLRLRVMHTVESGKTTREVSALFQVSSSFVSHVHQCWKQRGHVHSKPTGGYRRSLWNPTQPPSAHPSMMLKDVQAWLAREHGLTLSLSAIDKLFATNSATAIKKPWSPVYSNVTMWRRRVNKAYLAEAL